MTNWRRLAGARVLHTPIAVRLVDDFTGGAPLAAVKVALDEQAGPRWVATEVKATRSMSGIVGFPGLGRTQNPALAPVARYRIRVVDDEERLLYRPAHRFTADGLEFDVAPWSDTTLPASVIDRPERVLLWPGANYPFPSAIPVLRGRTKDAAGQPLPDARVTAGTDHVLSDHRGAFSVPLRLTSPATTILITAEHARSGTGTSVSVPLPAGLASALELQLV